MDECPSSVHLIIIIFIFIYSSYFFIMRIAIGAAIINDGKILLVRKKQSWILPGGKPEQKE